MNADLAIIRPLAFRLAQIAQAPRYAQARRNWAAHNSLTGDKSPLLWVCPDDDGGWQDLVPPESLGCTHPDLRALEFQLRKALLQHQHLGDDFVQEPVVRFDIPGVYTGYLYGSTTQTSAWGIDIAPMGVSRGAYHLPNYLANPDNARRMLDHQVDFLPDWGRYEALRNLYETAVDGALRVQPTIPYCALVQSLFIDLVHLRGLSDLMLDFYDNPAWLHQLLDHMSAAKVRLLEKLEQAHLLFDNRTNVYTGSGGLGYLPFPPCPDSQAQVGMLWGFADAQELSGVSPAMFAEFALPYQARGLSRFGMACYGCCEPLDDRFEAIFAALPNLRRLSVSPWSQVELAAKTIGTRAIVSWKPNPALLGVRQGEAQLLSDLRRWREATAGRCYTEVILKDIRTCRLEDLQAFTALYHKVLAES